MGGSSWTFSSTWADRTSLGLVLGKLVCDSGHFDYPAVTFERLIGFAFRSIAMLAHVFP